MFNRNGRTEEEAVEHQAKGVGKQIKGSVKEAWGALTGDHSTRREGTVDRLKGRLQEGYGNLKEKEADIERNLDDLDRDPI